MEHKWAFRARFRRNAFGWRSQPAIKRIREAVSEIRREARRSPVLGGEGAVLFLEKVAPALEHVDSSSGAIGTAVNKAIEALAPAISEAPADAELRDGWLERLWRAVEDDGIGYLDLLPDHWGELCATPERASRWADDLIPAARMAWSPNPELFGYFKGTPACLSALWKAGRNEEILELIELAPHPFWTYRKWGVAALAAMGREAEAIRLAEESRGPHESRFAIAKACEEILLARGRSDEAYLRYAIEANWKGTFLATFRAVVKKYPDRKPARILEDLVAASPGEEGKWFAAARSAGLLDAAIELANRSPCDPRTLTRAARDMEASEPRIAVEAGMAALRWLVAGYGYDITGADVLGAYNHTMRAAENAGNERETLERIRNLVAGETRGDCFAGKILGRRIGLDP